jgi:hypothetical protein
MLKHLVALFLALLYTFIGVLAMLAFIVALHMLLPSRF